VVIDADGLGAGVIDHTRFRGHSARLFEFHGGAAAHDANAYFDRRAEVWGSLREWLVAGTEIPDDPRACINHSKIRRRSTAVQRGCAVDLAGCRLRHSARHCSSRMSNVLFLSATTCGWHKPRRIRPMLINSVFAFVRCSLAIPVLNMAACMVLAIDNTNKSTSSTTEKVIVLKEFSVHSKLRKVG